VVLYEYSYSPSCGQVRAYLDYRAIPYTRVEVNPITKSQIAPYKTTREIPIAVINGEVVDVAIHVIRYLELGVEWEKDRRLAMSASLSQQRVWEEWMYQIDQNFVSLISANKFYTLSQAYKSLAPISGKGGGWGAAWARPLAAWILWRNWRKLRPVLEDVYGPNLQDALCLEAQRWHQRLQGQPFLGGEKPSVVDLYLFGVLRSVIDEGPDRALAARLKGTDLGAWYTRLAALFPTTTSASPSALPAQPNRNSNSVQPQIQTQSQIQLQTPIETQLQTQSQKRNLAHLTE